MKWLWEHRAMLLVNVLGSIIGAALYSQLGSIWRAVGAALGFAERAVIYVAILIFDLARHVTENPVLLVMIAGWLVASVTLSLLTAETRGVLHMLSKRLVLLAVRRLPTHVRRRWSDEWLAELEALDERPLTGFLFA